MSETFLFSLVAGVIVVTIVLGIMHERTERREVEARGQTWKRGMYFTRPEWIAFLVVSLITVATMAISFFVPHPVVCSNWGAPEFMHDMVQLVQGMYIGVGVAFSVTQWERKRNAAHQFLDAQSEQR